MVGSPLLPGDRASPVILHVPHSSRAVPTDIRDRIVLDDERLGVELDRMTDTATDVIAAGAADRAGVRPWRWVNPWSRLVVDPERFPDEQEPMRAVGMGAVYARTHDRQVLREPDPDHEADLLARFFTPYADGLADLVDARLEACGAAVLLDLHSYPRTALPYELHGDGPRPQVCLGTDADHTPDWLLEAATAAFDGWGVGLDSPFAGTYTPLPHWRREARVVSLMVELRRDTYLDDDLRPTPGLDAVAARLATLVDTVTSRIAAGPPRH